MKRRELLVAFAVYALSLGVLLVVSRQTGPARDELGIHGLVDLGGELVKRVAARGFGVLALPEHRATLDSGLLVLTGAWSKLSLGRLGVLDPISAARLPWLVVGACAPLALYLMLRPSRGRWVALGGAALCLAMPRFSHAVVVLDEGALVASCACLVLAAHVRALGPAHPGEPGAGATLAWATFGAVALGFGAALSLGVLWVLPLVILHFAWARRASLRRLLRQGRFPLPALVLVAIPVAPLVLLGLRPGLWKASPALLARFFLAPLEPSVARTELGAKVVDRLPVPGGFALTWLVHTLPLAVALLALAGLAAVVHEHLARRFASGSLRPRRDRHALGALALFGLGFGVVGPALTPDVLTTFPPRVELLVPFVALAGAIGLGRLAALTGSPRAGLAFAAVSVLAPALVLLLRASTASASAGPFGHARRALPLGDGSEVAALAGAIDGLGRPRVTLTAPPELPPEIWRKLHEARRMRTEVTVQGGGELVLSRGAAPAGFARVRRDGATLWTLARAGQ